MPTCNQAWEGGVCRCADRLRALARNGCQDPDPSKPPARAWYTGCQSRFRIQPLLSMTLTSGRVHAGRLQKSDRTPSLGEDKGTSRNRRWLFVFLKLVATNLCKTVRIFGFNGWGAQAHSALRCLSWPSSAQGPFPEGRTSVQDRGSMRLISCSRGQAHINGNRTLSKVWLWRSP